jgi:hypothetical protein
MNPSYDAIISWRGMERELEEAIRQDSEKGKRAKKEQEKKRKAICVND